jgi:23S rRNA pseudouridine1911/1915/1917 synthase
MQQSNILHQDTDILIVQKPAGVVVNRAETITQPTLQDWLEQEIPAIRDRVFPADWAEQLPPSFTAEYGTPEKIFADRSGIAHRLDKQTSGVFVCAMHPGALVSLLAQFRERKVQKKYLCLTHGKFAMTEQEIDLPIGRRSSNRKLFAVVPDGRSAVTQYRVEQYFAGFKEQKMLEEPFKQLKKRLSLYQGFSLVSCWPKTGRTHQIRVHMAHLQHPIVGDIQYVGKKRGKLDSLWCPRQFLHASEVTFTHPRTKQLVTFTAPLTADLQMVLDSLE